MPGIEIKGRSTIANYRHGGRTGKFGGGRTNLLEQLGRVEAEPSNPNRRAEISRVHGELNKGYAKGGRAGFKQGSTGVEHGRPAYKGRKGSERVIKAGGPPDIPAGYRKVHDTSGKVVDISKKEQYKVRGEKAEGGRAGFVHGNVAQVAKIAARKFRKPPGVFKVKGSKGSDELRPKQEIRREHRTKAKRSPTHPDDLRPEQAEGGRIGLKKGGSDKKWIQKAVDPKHKGYCTPMTKKTCTPARKALARTFKKKAKTGWG